MNNGMEMPKNIVRQMETFSYLEDVPEYEQKTQGVGVYQF